MEKYRFKKKFSFEKMNHVAFQDAFSEEELQDFRDSALIENWRENRKRIARENNNREYHRFRKRIVSEKTYDIEDINVEKIQTQVDSECAFNEKDMQDIRETVAREMFFDTWIFDNGRHKKGYYNGFYCDSSWELAFVIFALDHKYRIERSLTSFEYIEGNIKRIYYPDFYMRDYDTYIEVKGWMKTKDIHKLIQIPNKIVVLGAFEMKPILDYVKQKYGKNFVELYEHVEDAEYEKRVSFVKNTIA